MYRFFYNDGSYLDYALTEKDYNLVERAVAVEMGFVGVSIGIVFFRDVRSIVILPEPKEDNPNEGLPTNLDPESYAWLNQQRELETEKEDDDVDY